MSAKSIRFKLITPVEVVLEADADAVVLPLVDGWIGVLPGRLPFVARVAPGEMLIRLDGDETRVATTGGTAHVEPDEVTVLAGNAAVDVGLEELQARIDEAAQQSADLELQAEKHIEALYRQMAGISRRTQAPL